MLRKQLAAQRLLGLGKYPPFCCFCLSTHFLFTCRHQLFPFRASLTPHTFSRVLRVPQVRSQPLLFGGWDLGALAASSTRPGCWDEVARKLLIDFGLQISQALYTRATQAELAAGGCIWEGRAGWGRCTIRNCVCTHARHGRGEYPYPCTGCVKALRGEVVVQRITRRCHCCALLLCLM